MNNINITHFDFDFDFDLRVEVQYWNIQTPTSNLSLSVIHHCQTLRMKFIPTSFSIGTPFQQTHVLPIENVPDPDPDLIKNLRLQPCL